MKNEYLIGFSSFYKAAYARDLLMEKKYRTVVVKIPTELIQTCGYGLSVRTSNIQTILSMLNDMEVSFRSVYKIEKNEGQPKYRKIK
ncbi:MAG: DUF3343 domain-containing protein [Eubacteriales bacterium]|nr:DUF3343 domain-containing protein [Eubacteriales bacterium]MDD4389861.1 DUF3343 domain-containing protein [Eubacteriales bacterium]